MVRALFLMVSVLLLAPIASGVTFTVPGDYATIQAAIDDVMDGDVIEVLPGTYNEKLDMKGKDITLRSTAGPMLTIIDATGIPGTVILCDSGESVATVIQGFTLMGGTGADTVFPLTRGGGLYAEFSSPTVINCIFMGNVAQTGGGLYAFLGAPLVQDCLFIGNVATVGAGGGVYNDQALTLYERCVFRENDATTSGGGFENSVAVAVLLDCVFTLNRALAGNGGGFNTSAAQPVLTNCVFDRNSATLRGGGAHLSLGAPVATNCTFSANTAGIEGGGIYDNGASTVVNSIVWGNTPDQVDSTVPGSVSVTFSDVQGGFTGTGNINADPLFTNAPAGDLSLTSGSPCRDIGSNAAVPAGVTMDVVGNVRIFNVIVDMGAYEYVPGPQVLLGEAAGDAFGFAVAGLGDVSGDGVPDFAVGAPDGNSGKGYARVFSGADLSILWTRNGQLAGDDFGFALARSADLDNDGKDDLIVGAPGSDVNGADSGRVFVYSGADGTQIFQRQGKEAGDQFGFAVAGGVNVDGTGKPDVLVGGPGNNDNGADAGLLDILSGDDFTVIARRKGKPGDMFGSAVAGIGDADGLPGDDFVVGAPASSQNGAAAGKLTVFTGGASIAGTYAAVGQAAGDMFGAALTGAGDLSGDGRDDYVVGAPFWSAGRGRVYAYRANVRQRLWIVSGPAGSNFGTAVAAAGDLDCDSTQDIVGGAPTHTVDGNAGTGLVRLASGDGGAVLGGITGPNGGALYGTSASALGDLDSDGKVEFLVGAPGAGAAVEGAVYIESSETACP